jgi:hypothetical protein
MAQEPIGHAFRCQTDDPTRIVIPSSGESHQQDELSPVNKVQRERGISPELSPRNKVKKGAGARHDEANSK